MAYADKEYEAVEMECGMGKGDMETLIILMKLVIRRNAGTMIKVGWRRGIMWVRENGCVEPWVWSCDDMLRRLWMLRVGLLSGLLSRLMWRILRKDDRWLIRDDFVVSLPPEVKSDEC